MVMDSFTLIVYSLHITGANFFLDVQSQISVTGGHKQIFRGYSNFGTTDLIRLNDLIMTHDVSGVLKCNRTYTKKCRRIFN